MSYLILEDDEPQMIWDTFNNAQLVFHPKYGPNGEFDYLDLQKLKRRKEVILFLDRNLLSSLLSLTKDGDLKDEIEKRMIALLMLWAQMNQLPISAGLAIMENASKENDSYNAKMELKNFVDIFDFYPSQIWLQLADGRIDKIPKCCFSNIPYKNSISYHKSNDHFLMNYACMLHLVSIFRNPDMSPVEKILAFLSWNFENLLISQYINTYIVLLFSNQNGIKAPKHSNAKLFERADKGCINQAWDLTYLSIWSTLYWDESNKNEIFLFATADTMLKHIFINSHSRGNLFDLINTVFSKKVLIKLYNFILKICLIEKSLTSEIILPCISSL
ncbi:hypothetical protein [Neobacillus notoginsengisoli]|uniref:hypothetical protein n=1 Tax=Neobacillus notoginsengisoli TaxID=1578198 RepID=UPI001F027984|nr:hypothetical protein [Neobacillus notoginsengisoli]